MMTDARGYLWRPLASADLGRVDAIARIVHAATPECEDVLAEKRRLSPDSCFALETKAGVIGYCLAHPWMRGSVPALDAYLGAIPAAADALHIHDVAILDEGRGLGAATSLMDLLRDAARRRSLAALTLVSIYGTSPFWRRFGFVERREAAMAAALSSYGDAVYMVAPLQ